MVGILTGKHKRLDRWGAIDVHRTFVDKLVEREDDLSQAYWLDAGATLIVQQIENGISRRIQKQTTTGNNYDICYPEKNFDCTRKRSLNFSAGDVLIPTAMLASSKLVGGAEKVVIKPYRGSINAGIVLREITKELGIEDYIHILEKGKKSSEQITTDAIENPIYDDVHIVGSIAISKQWNPKFLKAAQRGKIKTGVIASSGKAPVLYIPDGIDFDKPMIEEKDRVSSIANLDHTPVGVSFINSVGGNGLYCNFSRVIFVGGGQSRAREFAEKFGALADSSRGGPTADSFNGPVKNGLALKSCKLAAGLAHMRKYKEIREFGSESVKFDGGRGYVLNPGIYMLNNSGEVMPWINPNDKELRKIIRNKFGGAKGFLASYTNKALNKAREMTSGFELYGPVTYIVPVESKEEFLKVMKQNPDLNLVADYFGTRDIALEKELVKQFGLVSGNKYSPESKYGPFDFWGTGAGGSIRAGENAMSHGAYMAAAFYSGVDVNNRNRGVSIYNRNTIFNGKSDRGIDSILIPGRSDIQIV